MIRLTVCGMFFTSGLAGLMYQVVWVRMLSRQMGVTIHATATVVAAFMGGLALGSYLAGRWIDRRKDPLRVYGVLELLIAAAALLVPLVLAVALPLYKAVYQASGEGATLTALIRFIVCFGALMVPTTMMGATLPVLTAYLVRKEKLFGRNFSLLYGLNTFGAVGGVLVAGFVTIGLLGEWATILIAAAINIAVGVGAIALHGGDAQAEEREADEAAADDAPISPYGDGARRFVLIAFAVSGLTALAYEVIWTRQLIIFLRTSIYAFSGMLAVFLLGIATGSVAMNRIVDRMKRPLTVFAGFELLVAFLSVLNLYLFGVMDGHVMHRVLGLANAGYATFLIVFPLTFTFGMITPVAARCYAKSVGRTGTSIGGLYSANTVGSIFGSLATGFLLIPAIGSTKTVLLLAAVNLVLGVGLLFMEVGTSAARKLAWAPVVILVAVMMVGTWNRDPFLATIESRIERRVGTTWMPDRLKELPPSQQIHLHEEGLEGTVTAFEINTFKQLWINGVGMTFLCTETKLMAHLPLLFVAEPREFLAVCFGMGTTIASAAVYPELEITTVELVPETFETFDYYHHDGKSILARDNVHPVVADGRNFLLLTDDTFDVITVDPPPPIWSARTVNLYSREFFEIARDRLSPDGVMCLWFPGGTKAEVTSLLRTFAEVFPHVTVWSGPHTWGYYFIGKLEPFDWDAFRARAARMFENPAVMDDLEEYDRSLVSFEQLETLLLWDETQVAEVAKQGVVITDNRPFTEFPLWRYLLDDRQRWNPQWELGIENWRERERRLAAEQPAAAGS